jgi:phospholipid-binding lipoprotein MlaA
MRVRTASFAVTTALLLSALVAGCAGHQPPHPDYDPWEPVNRKIFWFNDKADQYVLEPVARGWNYVVPNRMQRAFSDFFANLRFPIVFVNDLLQAKPHAAAESWARFEINTFFGGLGFYDLAAEHFGLPLQIEDTGQTFGVWDIAPGPYVVIPLFGPSNPRDAVGLVGDAALGFYTYFITVPGATLGATVIDFVNERSRYLEVVERAREASLDYYTFVRNAYVQQRWQLIHDQAEGNAPPPEEDLYNVEPYEQPLQGGTP